MAASKMHQGSTIFGEHSIRVVLLGKSGIGKSALGNSLLGKKKFKTSLLENKGTTLCQGETRLLDDGTELMITDTPGYFRSSRPNQEIIQEYRHIWGRGPHIFILVLSLNERFTGDENDTMEFFDAVFGEEVFNHMVVVFTGLDSFYDDTDLENSVNLESIIPPGSKRILLKCSNRYTCINNRDNEENKVKPCQYIVDQVKSLAAVNFNHYTKQIFERASHSAESRIIQLEQRRTRRLQGDGGMTYRSVGGLSWSQWGYSWLPWCYSWLPWCYSWLPWGYSWLVLGYHLILHVVRLIWNRIFG